MIRPTALLALALATAASTHVLASDSQFPVDPGKLLIRQTKNGTKIDFRARRGSVAVTGDPTFQGAYFQLFNSAGGSDVLCAPMPAAGWRQLGEIEFRYRDTHNAFGPVVSAHFGTAGSIGSLEVADIRVALRGGSYSLDEATQGSIAAVFRLSRPHNPGDPDYTRYCTDFVPPQAAIKRDVPGKFLAVFADQILEPCNDPPSVCGPPGSPNGAFINN